MYKKIICATNFTKQSNWAVAHAVELAREYGAELIVCHLIESPYKYMRHHVYAKPGSEDLVFMDAGVQSSYEAHLKSVHGQALGDQAHRTVVHEGAPSVEILRLARKEDADLIVLGSTQRGEVIGQTAGDIISRARCPVAVLSGPYSYILMGQRPERRIEISMAE